MRSEEWRIRLCGAAEFIFGWLAGVGTYEGIEPSALSLELDRPCGPDSPAANQ